MRATRDVVRVAGLPALVLAAVLLVTASRHGLHGDELYFRMLPAAWWYDDQPPLTVWLARLAVAAGDATWVHRLPAVAAAALSVLLAAGVPRVLGHGAAAQRVAAWAHGFTVYPLLVGHVLLTATVDLVVWQAVVLLVLVALRGRTPALAWAGLVAGLGCWNKLLVLVLVAALGVALLLARPRLLRSRHAGLGALALTLVGGPQVLAQVLHGLPMSAVSADLVARQGDAVRPLVLPLTVAFLGPPLVAVCARGLALRPGPDAPAGDGREAPVLGVTAALVLAWNLAVPAQPYYAVPALLPALAAGWGRAQQAGAWSWRRRWVLVGANGAVAVALCLPLAPPGTAAFAAVAGVVPVQRDQAGWPDLVAQVAAVRPPGAGVLVDSYALAGAVARYGPALGIPPGSVASGHDALWSLGPPPSGTVLVVGARGAALRSSFARCDDAGTLRAVRADPFTLAGSPVLRCRGPLGGWDAVWPRFRHLGG